MVFSSIPFLIYFLPVFLILYIFIDKKYKNPLLLLASIAFYSWGAPRFIFVILGTTMLDFYLVRLMHESASQRRRKIYLLISLSLNLGLLFYFKYCNFFIENINAIFFSSKPIPLLNVVLPIGISFYTFESLTYVVDVYRKVHKPLDNFWNYQLYIIMFPKLIAGPIIRYHEIADQIPDRSATENNENRVNGFYRFGIGLAKKVLIANVLAVKADEVFNSPPEYYNAAAAWIGVLSYTFQIYFDFSGYSDMAIGIGKIMGFTFPENFNSPYSSQSVTEFWRRWHITLGNWMKNYLYIPLGGNRTKSKARLYFNLWVVFLASGLWHGASWTFVIWGAYHGTFLVLERIFLSKLLEKSGRIISTLFTFLVICLGWVFFRADTPAQALIIIQKLFSGSFQMPPFFIDGRLVFYLSLAAFFSFLAAFPAGKKMQDKIFAGDFSSLQIITMAVIICFMYVFSLAALASGEINPFIYFRF